MDSWLHIPLSRDIKRKTKNKNQQTNKQTSKKHNTSHWPLDWIDGVPILNLICHVNPGNGQFTTWVPGRIRNSVQADYIE